MKQLTNFGNIRIHIYYKNRIILTYTLRTLFANLHHARFQFLVKCFHRHFFPLHPLTWVESSVFTHISPFLPCQLPHKSSQPWVFLSISSFHSVTKTHHPQLVSDLALVSQLKKNGIYITFFPQIQCDLDGQATQNVRKCFGNILQGNTGPLAKYCKCHWRDNWRGSKEAVSDPFRGHQVHWVREGASS